MKNIFILFFNRILKIIFFEIFIKTTRSKIEEFEFFHLYLQEAIYFLFNQYLLSSFHDNNNCDTIVTLPLEDYFNN